MLSNLELLVVVVYLDKLNTHKSPIIQSLRRKKNKQASIIDHGGRSPFIYVGRNSIVVQ